MAFRIKALLVSLLAVTGVFLSGLSTASVHAATLQPKVNIGGCHLYEGHQLNANDTMTCTNTPDRLVMQSDGNLVIYSNSTAVWANGKYNKESGKVKYWAIMQNDGNFVEYCTGGTCGTGAYALWATNTFNNSFDGALNWVELDYHGARGQFAIIQDSENPLIEDDELTFSCNLNRNANKMC